MAVELTVAAIIAAAVVASRVAPPPAGPVRSWQLGSVLGLAFGGLLFAVAGLIEDRSTWPTIALPIATVAFAAATWMARSLRDEDGGLGTERPDPGEGLPPAPHGWFDELERWRRELPRTREPA